MPLVLISFFAFFLCTSGYGAETPNTRIDSLNKAALAISDSSYARARPFAIEAKQASLHNNYMKGRVESTCLLSLIAVTTNDAIAACDSLNRLLQLPSGLDPYSRQLTFITLATCWYLRGDFDSARKYVQPGVDMFPSSGLPLDNANAYLIAARIYSNKGMPTQAMEYYNKALGILSKTPNRKMQALAGDMVAGIYYRQRLYEKAIAALKQSLAEFKAEGNRSCMISSLVQLANNYFMTIKDDSAETCYNNALSNAIALGDTMSMAVNYSNLSRIFLEHRQAAKAVAYSEHALAIIKPGNYPTIEAGTYQQLGDIYAELKQNRKAVTYVERALATARAAGNKQVVRDCYKSLSEIYEEMKELKPAFSYLRAAYRIKDSIQSTAFSGQIADMEVKYETEKKRSEIRLLQQQQQIDQLKMAEQQHKINRKNILLLALGLLVVSISIAVYFYMSRRRQAEYFRRMEAIRMAEETERQRIAKDIHDELGSGLSRIAILSDMLTSQVSESGKPVAAIHSISDTSRHLIDNMRDMVWNMNPENTTLDNLVARLREYASDYLGDLPMEVTMNIPHEAPAQKISMEVSRNVHMILKECLQNIVKHAQATQVGITVRTGPHFSMQIRDNGKGYDPATASRGNGIKNITARSRAIGAKLTMESLPGKGSSVLVEVKLPT